jgi:two-component system response regulator RegA
MIELKGTKILLVEDDRGLREVLTEELQEKGLHVSAFAETPRLPLAETPEWALLDLRVGSESSLDFLKELTLRYPAIRVVMMSGFGSVASAVKAMQLGAHNFITKPVTVDMILKSFLDQDVAGDENDHEISLARMEREYIDYILQNSDGNITQAARKLGLHRQSLQRKLRKNIPK